MWGCTEADKQLVRGRMVVEKGFSRDGPEPGPEVTPQAIRGQWE